MSQPKLYMYALVYHPEPAVDGAGNVKREKSVILVDLTRVLANSTMTSKEILAVAHRSVPDEYADRLDRIEFIIHNLSGS